jgi:hypothetical protein
VRPDPPVAFAALNEFTLETYGKTTLDDLRVAEEQDPRHWWLRRHERAATGD